MSRAKPLSLEEKTRRVLSLMQEKDDIFGLKDLEKVCQKEKGVIPQSIKEVIDILVSENKVKEKKVGASRFYWSFRSDIKINKENRHEKLSAENKKLKEQKEALLEEIDVLEKNRSTLPDREDKIKILVEHRKKQKELETVTKQMEENDPSKLLAIGEEIDAVTKSLTEWADAFNILQSYVKNTFNMTQKDFCNAFPISMDDLEKIEEL
ncbi:hypothetical protein NEMIN01_0277 [Nematocida minor]|uniref:uncharacterized protein n=1 Tax=Nematocida minor TaxID=1912983 RepID=UPI0022201A41|nr:uncharacterized protein NEMIN01_0277 [Nematocida minor]KAI5189111.1 hypothetical protein NEMIN01_0277 [Nematocida minor]